MARNRLEIKIKFKIIFKKKDRCNNNIRKYLLLEKIVKVDVPLVKDRCEFFFSSSWRKETCKSNDYVIEIVTRSTASINLHSPFISTVIFFRSNISEKEKTSILLALCNALAY